MDKRQTVLKLVGRVLAVLIILWVSSLVTRYVDRVIGQTGQAPLLDSIYWGRCLPEFCLLALAGFVLAVPDDCRRRRICWLRFLLLGIPALVVALFLPFLYYNPLAENVPAYGNFVVRLLALSSYRSVAGFWFGVALALAT